jgi:hypothetical protein
MAYQEWLARLVQRMIVHKLSKRTLKSAAPFELLKTPDGIHQVTQNQPGRFGEAP